MRRGIGGGERVAVGSVGGVGRARSAVLAGAGGPEVGVDVGEDAVAFFDGGEAGFLFRGDGVVGFEMLPDGLELVELVDVGLEAELGVVAGGAGGDEELPVGGFEQEELAAELLDDALGDRLVGVAVGFPVCRRCRRRGGRARRDRSGRRSRRFRGSSRRGWCLRRPRSLRAS